MAAPCSVNELAVETKATRLGAYPLPRCRSPPRLGRESSRRASAGEWQTLRKMCLALGASEGRSLGVVQGAVPLPAWRPSRAVCLPCRLPVGRGPCRDSLTCNDHRASNSKTGRSNMT